MNVRRIIACLAALLAAAGSLPAQEPSPTAQVPDLLKGLVPFAPGAERGRFQADAGVDNELEESEIKEGGGAFVRPFESWPLMIPFDRNKNARLDWFEADAYRRALQKAVLTKYDADKDGRLNTDERLAANRDLSEGKVPPIGGGDGGAPPAPPSGGANNNPFAFQFGQPGQLPPQLMQMLDTDGDGQLSKDERVAGIRNFRDRGWQWALGQYDRDGDGKLSEEERSAAPPPVRFIMKIDDLGLRDFDEDGDGKLSDAEYGALDDYFQKWMKVSNENMIRFADTDGDGQLSDAEQSAVQAKMQAMVFQILPKAMSWADTDGDGQASPQEWMGLFDNFSNSFDHQIDRYTKRFDANGDGRLDAAERDTLIEGLVADDLERQKQFDADGDGQLSVKELMALFENQAEEWGVKPKSK